MVYRIPRPFNTQMFPSFDVGLENMGAGDIEVVMDQMW